MAIMMLFRWIALLSSLSSFCGASSPTPLPTETRGVYGRTSFYETVLTDAAVGVYNVYGADLDDDGNIDILCSMRDSKTVAWFKNYGNMTFGPMITISSSERGVSQAVAADVRGVGALDVIVANEYSAEAVWFKNNDNASSFTRYIIDDSCLGCASIAAKDVNNDGHIDLMTTAPNAKTVAWYENDGRQNFTKHVISSTATDVSFSYYVFVLQHTHMLLSSLSCFENQVTPLGTGDFNDDGNLDIVVGASGDSSILLYLGDGAGTFTLITVSTDVASVTDIDVGDVDGDGDLDIVSISSSDSAVYWHENNGNGMNKKSRTTLMSWLFVSNNISFFFYIATTQELVGLNI